MNPARIRAVLRTWFGRAQRPLIIIGALAIIGGGVLVFEEVRRSSIGTNEPSTITSDDVRAPTAERVRRWIDGMPLATGAAQPFAVAIVIDNAPEALPQFGLADAPLVFEVPVEGGRTRLLAVVPTDGGAQPIGPVRSARPYFVGLAAAVGAPLVHVGGSAAALALLRGNRWLHINQYFDPPFWRDPARAAPFNVYTAASNLGAFIRTQGWEESLRAAATELWRYVDDHPLSLPLQMEGEKRSGGGNTIRLPFDRHGYVVEWWYDADAGVYIRSQGGPIHRVRSGADEREVRAVNVVVLRIRSRVLDAIGRLEIPALEPPIQPMRAPRAAAVYTGGRRIDGTWDWNVGGSPRFQFLQPNGTPIALRPGTTWVEFTDAEL